MSLAAIRIVWVSGKEGERRRVIGTRDEEQGAGFRRSHQGAGKARTIGRLGRAEAAFDLWRFLPGQPGKYGIGAHAQRRRKTASTKLSGDGVDRLLWVRGAGSRPRLGS